MTSESLGLSVCPHDTAKNPDRWFTFAQYLGQQLEATRIRFSPSAGFADYHRRIESADIVYANPQDTFNLCTGHGFHVVARASNLFDEVVIVANSRMSALTPNLSLRSVAGREVASVPSMLPTCLALAKLRMDGVVPARLVGKDSWLAVMNAVARNEVPFGFIYKDYFDGLGRLSRKMVRVLDETNEGSVYHSFLLNPRRESQRGPVTRVLLGMHETPRGKAVLSELGMERLIASDEAILGRVTELRGLLNQVALQ